MTLAIRRLFATDEPALCQAVQRSLPELERWMPWATPRFDSAMAADFINGADSATRMELAVTWNNEFIGVCGANQISPVNRSANLGYWLRSDMTGRGFGWQAAKLATQRVVEERGIHRFQITISVNNPASQATAERLGAHFEGIARDALLLQGEFHDASVYSYFADAPGHLKPTTEADPGDVYL